MLRIVQYAVLIVLLSTLSVSAAPYNMLIDDLVSGDAAARVHARKLLPRESVEAIPRLLTYVDHEDPQVWWAVMRVLEDFAYQVTVPGREEDRHFVTEQLMEMLDPAKSERMQEYGLRILPFVLPEGYDVAPIAAYLDGDAIFRERARAALLNAGTTEAADALMAALPDADDAFKAALLDALGQMRAVDAKDTALVYTRHDQPEVRAAAASALAWQADAALVPVLRGVRAQADDATHRLATDALLRLAESLALAGGNWTLAMDTFVHVLEDEADPVMRNVALSGLGRFGDESYVAYILEELREDAGGYMTGAAIQALEAMPGRGPKRQMLEAYEDMPEAVKPVLLGMFGRTQEAIFLPLLNEAVNSDSAVMRDQALQGLIDSGLPGAVEGLEAYAQNASGEQKAVAVEALRESALRLRDSGNSAGAGRAYLAVYLAATDEALREEALEGILQNPVSDAFSVLIDEIGTENLESLSTEMLIGMVSALREAGRDEEARDAYNALVARSNTTEGAQALIDLAASMGQAEEISDSLGFIAHWHVVGPFPWSAANNFEEQYIGEPDVDLDATYEVRDENLSWQAVTGGGMQRMVNLAGMYDNITNATAFAYTEIEAPAAISAVARVGSDDGFKIWVNGEDVYENNVDRGAALDQDLVPIELEAGVNRILMQITQGGGGWNFSARLTDTEGYGLAFE